MLIDFTPVDNNEMKILEFSRRFTAAELKAGTHASLDHILALIGDADDAQIAFEPHDPNANDPHAVAGEEAIGWTVGHLVAHVTASSEEWASYGSILARGIVYPAEPRLRYETPWREMNTRAKVLQRIEESRRIRTGYLDAMPDEPRLDVFRELSERFVERVGEMNAFACVLFGMRHEWGHYAQIAEALRQARGQ
jgi:uncharacterized damage-inducible protein DinB